MTVHGCADASLFLCPLPEPFFLDTVLTMMSTTLKRIALIGFMGSGKSTVGRLLAEKLGWNWADTDAEIEKQTGKTISEIFNADGEEAFRQLESSSLNFYANKKSIVLSTGGGIVLRAENRELLKNFFVIYLQVLPETAVARNKTGKRPLLNHPQPLERARQLLGEREALYKDTADLLIPESDLDLDKRMEDVYERIRSAI